MTIALIIIAIITGIIDIVFFGILYDKHEKLQKQLKDINQSQIILSKNQSKIFYTLKKLTGHSK